MLKQYRIEMKRDNQKTITFVFAKNSVEAQNRAMNLQSVRDRGDFIITSIKEN